MYSQKMVEKHKAGSDIRSLGINGYGPIFLKEVMGPPKNP